MKNNNMNILRWLFPKKPVKKTPVKNITVTAVAGRPCPCCGGFGLFREVEGYRCEECLTSFDHDLKPKDETK